MLGKCGILTKAEAEKIVAGLEEIGEEIARGEFHFDRPWKTSTCTWSGAHGQDRRGRREAPHGPEPERPGGAGPAPLRAGGHHRHPRRDPHAPEGVRLQGEVHLNTVMPGYTHLQRAQPSCWPITSWPTSRCCSATGSASPAVSPGCQRPAAGGRGPRGTTLPIDPAYVAKLLDFPAVAANSEDACPTGLRVEFLSCCAILACTSPGWPRSWCCGPARSSASSSSPTPSPPAPASCRRRRIRTWPSCREVRWASVRQPRQPAHVLRDFLSYNRDLQEDKEPVFDTADTIRRMLDVLPHGDG